MGCFLTITQRDFSQLSASLKAHVSVVDFQGNEVDIQVHSSAYRSAREMARRIRRQVAKARTITPAVKQQERALPTDERYRAKLAALLKASPTLALAYHASYEQTFRSKRGEVLHSRGKTGERAAVQILEQAQYLDGSQEIRVARNTGVDITGRSRAGNTVVVEVKTSDQPKDFADLLSTDSYEDYSSDGSGCRQSSDDWFRAVAEKKDISLDLERATILGVHINPSTQTVSLYRRIDSGATRWKPLMRRPLSDFHLKDL